MAYTTTHERVHRHNNQQRYRQSKNVEKHLRVARAVHALVTRSPRLMYRRLSEVKKHMETAGKLISRYGLRREASID